MKTLREIRHWLHCGAKTVTSLAGLIMLLLINQISTQSANAQGLVAFNNRQDGILSTRVYAPGSNPGMSLIGNGSDDYPSGTTDWTGFTSIGATGTDGQYGAATVFAQLLGASGYNVQESNLLPAAGVTPFRSGIFAGVISEITSTLTDVPLDAPEATLEMVAWDNSSALYPTWGEASVAWAQGLIAAGKSGTWNQDKIGGDSNPPPYMINSVDSAQHVKSFNLYWNSPAVPPQPSITAFAVSTNNTCSLTWTNDPRFLYSIRCSSDLKNWTDVVENLAGGFKSTASWSSQIPTDSTGAYYQVVRQPSDFLLTCLTTNQPARIAWCYAGTTGQVLRTAITLQDTDTNGVYDTLTREDYWADPTNTYLRLFSTARDTPIGRLVSSTFSHGAAESNLFTSYVSSITDAFGSTNLPVTRSGLSYLVSSILPALAAYSTNPVCLMFPKQAVSNAASIQFDEQFTVAFDDPGLVAKPEFFSGSTLCAATCVDAIRDHDKDGCGVRFTLKQVSPGLECDINEGCLVDSYRVTITRNGFLWSKETICEAEYPPRPEEPYSIPLPNGNYTMEIDAQWGDKCACRKRWGRVLQAWDFKIPDCSSAPPATCGPPKIKTPPRNVSRMFGQDANFKVEASGGELTYQWSFNGAPIVDDSRTYGSRSSELRLKNVQPEDAGIFSVRVSNPSGSKEDSATLSLQQALIVTPSSLSVREGNDAQFEVFLAAPITSRVTVGVVRTIGDSHLRITSNVGWHIEPDQWKLRTPVTIHADEDADSENDWAEFHFECDLPGIAPVTRRATEVDNDVSPTGPELIVNGDFSQEAEGFETDYTWSSGDMVGGECALGHTAAEVYRYGGTQDLHDHTSGTGLMFCVNASITANTVVWQETVQVEQQRSYLLRGWGATWLLSNPAQLRFEVNGELVGMLNLPDAPTWTLFSEQWNSGTATTATIRIIDTRLQGYGDDFALDDLSFRLVQ
jgi:hypothetical protein